MFPSLRKAKVAIAYSYESLVVSEKIRITTLCHIFPTSCRFIMIPVSGYGVLSGVHYNDNLTLPAYQVDIIKTT